MQFSMRTVLAAAALAKGVSAGTSGDKTITQVVKMLEGMLAQSKADGDIDRKLYAKMLCYCNSKKETKTSEIKELSEVIALLEDQIAQLRGHNAELSSEAAQLKADMAANVAKRAELLSIRNSENAAYLALQGDSTTAIGQMEQALQTLAEIGADQTMGAAADHAQFMAKGAAALQINARVGLKTRLQSSLKAASVFLGGKQADSVQAFLQAPFTGTYTAQSGEVVGILKQMKETFEKTLADATAHEEAAQADFDKITAALLAAHGDMDTLYNEKQTFMGENDNALASATSELSSANTEKDTRETFMSTLIPMCDEKAEKYQERNQMRANEDAAITEAISILDQDSAFATFGTVAATSTGASAPAFLQMGLQRAKPRDARTQIGQLLQQAAHRQKSLRLVKIAAMLQAGNPFTAVLEAIEKLIVLIANEGQADLENLNWCNSERTSSDNRISELDGEILTLTNAISQLNTEIDEPETGLKAVIEATEVSLKENYHSQVSQTEQRASENQAYQANIANLVQAQALLQAAVNVLEKYYSQIDTAAATATTPAPTMAGDTDAVPTTHEDSGHQGQVTAGNSVLTMLNYIKTNTHQEEVTAHTDEHGAQHAFEDSMSGLKTEEANLQSTLATLREELAEKEKQLGERQAELKAAENEHSSVNSYLLSIKAGCDFITENIVFRDTRRASETTALQGAITLIKDTPVYMQAVAEAHLDSLGHCRDRCVENGEEHVICKACLAKVEIPGYCAGHPGTEGC